ncbi:hypothetical protein [Archangium sp.]|uniref:hypothetical protein n=1 Tax=Archangium sp. TaxID=1872627 RepID=UPI00389A2617
MRRLVCAVAVSFGMLMGCGGDVAVDNTRDTLESVEQGLACIYPNNTCPSGTVCVDTLCRKACPTSGICSSGAACRVGGDGTPYCI